MADAQISVTFDGKTRMSLIRGEDRLFALQFKDENNNGLPLDLTGCQLCFAVPQQVVQAAAIKRTCGAYTRAVSLTDTGAGTAIRLPSHGFVTGDRITMAPGSVSQPLPPPFAAQTPYFVEVLTPDVFVLSVDPTFPKLRSSYKGVLVVSLEQNSGFIITDPVRGQALVALPRSVTEQMSFGQGLSCQITIQDALGVTRIVIAANALDVFTAPCP